MNNYRVIFSDGTTRIVLANNLQEAKRLCSKRIINIYKIGKTSQDQRVEYGIEVMTRN